MTKKQKKVLVRIIVAAVLLIICILYLWKGSGWDCCT